MKNFGEVSESADSFYRKNARAKKTTIRGIQCSKWPSYHTPGFLLEDRNQEYQAIAEKRVRGKGRHCDHVSLASSNVKLLRPQADGDEGR